LKNESGEKDFKLNWDAARKWPQTYAELSKGEQGIHLHYIYKGDPKELSRLYDTDIEVKVFTGKSSLRRKLTKCNNLPIATIHSGLPLREVKQVTEDYTIKSEIDLRNRIKKNLRKEVWPNTKPSMDFIFKILEDAYNQGLSYDVTDMRSVIQSFAMGSTHQAEYCMRLVSKMKWKSDDMAPNVRKAMEDDIPMEISDV